MVTLLCLLPLFAGDARDARFSTGLWAPAGRPLDTHAAAEAAPSGKGLQDENSTSLSPTTGTFAF